MSQTAADENGAMDKVFVLPPSFAQQRLWFMDQLLPGHVLFNLNFAIRLRQQLDVAILERSLNEIVRRHETLRTTFAFADDQPVQVIVATRRLTLPIRDLGKCSLEGSRPGNALFLHAGLHIIGKRGYGSLIDENIRKTIGMAVSIRARPEFELLTEPQTNILFYRYIPLRWRTLAKRREFPEVARREINLCNERIQSAQSRAGQTFVSRTTLRATHIGHRGPVVALRAVIANPATTERDIEAVLDDQVENCAASGAGAVSRNAADAGVEAGAEEEVFVFPLSFGQERLWFMDQVLPENPLFNLNIPLRLRRRLNPSIPTRALNEIVRRHESLRTRIATVDGRPVQLVSATLKHALPVIDLRRLPAADREREASRLANEEAQRPFDLARGPLLRTTLLQLREDDFVLLVTMHHIISDGWSLGIFWNELSAIWAAFAAGKPSSLAEPFNPVRRFRGLAAGVVGGPVLEEQLAFWRAKLRDAPTLQLPTDFPRPVVQTFSGALRPLALSVELTDGLRNLAQLAGTTLFMTLLAGFEALLHRYSGQEDIVTGTYIAGRNRVETEGVIGFFLNSLVLRLDAGGDPTFREMLARVRATTLEAYSHQDVPFEKLVEELQPERDLGRNPFFQVMFQLLNVPTLSRFERGKNRNCSRHNEGPPSSTSVACSRNLRED